MEASASVMKSPNCAGGKRLRAIAESHGIDGGSSDASDLFWLPG